MDAEELIEVSGRSKLLVGGVKLSRREVEILAFLLNGRSHKFIADSFGLSVRTVETHARNIAIKSKYGSLECFIDSLASSDDAVFLRKVYVNLLRSNEEKKHISWVERIKGEKKIKIVLAGVLSASFLGVMREIYPRSYGVITNRESNTASAIMLPRNKLQKKLSTALRRVQGIDVASLVGIGGAGKTKLAGMYMYTAGYDISYQLNAETEASLNRSFIELAGKLSSNDRLKEELRSLLAEDDRNLRKVYIIEFVKKLLRGRRWLLVYDNLEDPSVIYNYFPNDTAQWGEGKVIITTRDGNILANLSLGNNEIIKVEPLSQEEQIQLFNGITTKISGKEYSKDEILSLMSLIPTYPLDVSMVACSIANSNMSIAEYTEKLKQDLHNFGRVDKKLMIGPAPYGKSRYGIVVSTLRRIIEEARDSKIKEMLLLLSMCDSQNIPVGIFKRYGGISSCYNFITTLKKYSCIEQKDGELFIHRTIQNMWFNILKSEMDSECICNVLDTLISDVIALKNVSYFCREIDTFKYEKSLYDSFVEHEKKLLLLIDDLPIDDRKRAGYQANLLAVMATTLLEMDGDYKYIANCLKDALLLDRQYSIFSDEDRAIVINTEVYARSFFDIETSSILSAQALELGNALPGSIPLKILQLVSQCRIKMMENDYEGGMKVLNKAMSLIPKGEEFWKKLAYAQVKYFQEGYTLENHFNDKALGKRVAQCLLGLIKGLGVNNWEDAERQAREDTLVGLIPVLMFEVLRAYNDAEMYNEADEYFSNYIKFSRVRKDFRSELMAKVYHCTTLLRMGKLDKQTEDLLAKVYRGLKMLEDNSQLVGAVANLSEFYVRTGEYKKALSVNDVECDSSGTIQRLSYARSLYNFAVASYALQDDTAAREYYVRFLENIKNVCSICLSKEDFDSLNKSLIINIPANTKECLNNGKKIFSAVFGKDHAFVTGYLNKLKY